MDKLLIQGGTALSGEVAISGAKNAALPILCASLLTAEPLHFTNVPQLKDISTMLRLLGDMGVGVTTEGVERHGSRRRRAEQSGRLLRAGQDHARVDSRSRAAGGARRRGAGLAARRLRHRRAAGRSAHQGPAGDGRRNPVEQGYVHAKAQSPQGRAHLHRHGHRDRHREPDDGGLPRRRRNDHRECRARAGSGRSGQLPGQHGRPNFRCRYRRDPHPGCRTNCTARPTPSCRTASRPAPTCALPPLPVAMSAC